MKKTRTFETASIKTQADKAREMRTVKGSDPTLNRGLVSCDTQLFARSIAGVHDAKSNKRGTKNPNGRKATKVALRKGSWD